MGILLPPVPQATAATLTMHHRNRSLDSALQRIPEVDVTPSPECEANPTPSTIVVPSIKSHSREREDLASLGSDDSGILCGSESGSSDTANAATRESSVEHLHSRESLDGVDTVDGDISAMSNSRLKPVPSDCLSKEICNGAIDAFQDSESKRNSKDVEDPADESVDESCANDDRCLSKDSIKNDNVNAICRHTLHVNAMQNDLAGAAITLCCGTGQSEIKLAKRQQDICRQETLAQPKSSKGCLLRLFESQVFDMSMAISYLFNSKEPGVQSYLGKSAK